ncbi:MAG: hypothetical protein AB8C84_00830 [Oligoflexales bacterium]
MTSKINNPQSSIHLAAYAFFLTFVCFYSSLRAEPKIFFDADQTSINKDGLRQKFEGHVVAMRSGTMIRAESIEVDRVRQVFIATGHVLVVGKSQAFFGETLEHKLDSDDFTLTKAELIAGDEQQTSQIRDELLGITQKELDFELAKQQQLQNMAQRKENLRTAYANHINTPLTKTFIKQYALLLEQEEMIQRQPNPHFEAVSTKKRELYKRRRQTIENAIDPMGAKEFSQGTYFRLKGDQIVRSDYSQIDATQASWSPCRCSRDESPAWGFSSSHISARPGGYAFMQNPILHIKGIPILYLPWLMIPLKDRRQSGLLLPTITHQGINGNMISLPIFFAFSPQTDATITSTFIEKRGLRVDLENRVKLRQHSGWNLHIEALRDQQWLEQRAQRSQLLNSYTMALDTAKNNPRIETAALDDPVHYQANKNEINIQRLSSPRWWERNGLSACLTQGEDSLECIEQSIQEPLTTELNSWRGRLKWESLIRITPRLSFSSDGDIHSDHRYAGDVFVPTDYVSALNGRKVFAFANTNIQSHFDHSDIYIGLGSHYTDNMTSTHNRYHGFQIPARLKMRTRLFSFGDRYLPHPVYFSLGLDAQKIQNIWPDYRGQLRTLGDGAWRRSSLNLALPVVSDQIVRIDQFADAEVRTIQSSSAGSGMIQSWRFGWNFNLPLDGVGSAPWLKPGTGHSHIRHTMNWGLQLSARPVAIRTGDYGNQFAIANNSNSSRLLYYSSDRKDYAANRAIGFIPDEHAMIPHQRIVFHTNHDWQIFKQQWGQVPGANTTSPAHETILQQAERELLFQLDQPIRSVDKLMTKKQWISHRYRRTEVGHQTPLHFDAETSWDRLKEIRRTAQLSNNKHLEQQADTADTLESATALLAQRVPYSELIQPWSPIYSHLNFHWKQWSLNSTFTYDIYNRITPHMAITVTPPEFYKNHFNFGYVIERKVTGHTDQLQSARTLSKSIHTQSYMISNVHLRFEYTQRITEGQDKPTYRKALGASYTSPSQCWGLQLARQKEFEQDERHPNYTLNLVVHFGPQTRSFGNMATALTRELPQNQDKG